MKRRKIDIQILIRSFLASLQELNILYELPIINLETRNPKLFIFIPTLSLIKKLRENLGFMRQYLSECRIATSEKLLEAEVGKIFFF